MADDMRFPTPQQAVLCAGIPVLTATVIVLFEAVVGLWEPAPGSTASILAWVGAGVLFMAGGVLQYRFVRRAAQVDMIDRDVPLRRVTIFTMIGCVLGIAAIMLIGDGPRPTGPAARHAIGFDVFVALVMVWLSAWAALALGRSRTS